MRMTRPPWQRRGAEQKQDAEDELWLLEQSLSKTAQPHPQAAAAAAPPPLKKKKKQQKKQKKDEEDDEGGLRDTQASGAPPQQSFVVAAAEAGARGDKFVAERLPGQSRSAVGDLFDRGFVLVNGSPARKSLKLVEGDQVDVMELTAVANLEVVEPEDIPLDVLYEDEHMIVVNKAPGMVVHPAPGNRNGTFVNAFLAHVARAGSSIEAIPGTEGRPGVVHRLDKGTSGVLLAAKTAQAHAALSAAFSERRVNKTYLAVSIGNPSSAGAVIDAPIGRHPKDRQRMAVAMKARAPTRSGLEEGEEDGEEEEEEEEDEMAQYEGELLMGKGGNTGSTPLVGRTARSTVKTLAFDGRLSVVQVGIETGRTHQIRVHLQHRRNPVLGDELYGNAQWNGRAKRRWGIDRPMLHALWVEVAHPVTGEPLRLVAPVPQDMMAVVHNIWPQVKGKEEEAWWELSEFVNPAEEEEEDDEEAEQEAERVRVEKERIARLVQEGKMDEFGWEMEEED